MKIALPTRTGLIDSHFGHCEYYTIVELDADKNVVSKKMLEAPQGCGCKSNIAFTLAELGVELMLAGNMGQGAVNVLASQNIKVLRGCSGDVDSVVTAWLDGKLTDNVEVCDHHDCNH
jgi:predicted Fe-Mo cluster-binding NifX family protein